MPLKLNLTIPNKAVHVFIGLVVVVALVVGVYAYAFPGGFIGHGGDAVWISIPSAGEMTLQTAIDTGIFSLLAPFIPVCADGEILKFNAGNLECGTDDGASVPFIPTCSDDEILKFNAGNWECSADETLSLLECAADEYLKFDGTEWVCDSGGSPCTPSSACVAITCVGEQCSDSCGNLYAGTKTDGICCIDTSWSPATSTVCLGTTFTQTSDCDRTRSASGTMTGGTCCIVTTWSPSPSTVCSGTTFTQTSNCGTTRSATGTKFCEPVCAVPGTTCTLCVSGNYSSCVSSGGTWTGTQCCFSNVSTCTTGNYSSCVSTGGKWSGTYCCARGTCVSGNYSSCVSSGGTWTGTKCCVANATLCVSGNYSSCVSTGGSWTGTYCCVPYATACVSGNYSSCVSSGGTWTGTYCCV